MNEKTHWGLCCSNHKYIAVTKKKLYNGSVINADDFIYLKHATRKTYKDGDALACRCKNIICIYDVPLKDNERRKIIIEG